MGYAGELRTEFDDFARAISDVVSTDVIITDKSMRIIGSAFQYFSLYQDIKVGSLIGEVLYNGKDLLVEHKREKRSCRLCAEYAKCKMEAFIGVPIRDRIRTIGVIALILPKDKGRELFKKRDSTVTFMHSMAELIASKIHSSQRSKIMEEKNAELRGILDANPIANVYTDCFGTILFVNEAFKRLFFVTEELLGSHIQELFPYDYIRRIFQKRELKPEMLKAAAERNQFYGIINVEPIHDELGMTTVLFSFRRYGEIQSESAQFDFANGSCVTFDFLEEICTAELLEEAARFARSEERLLYINTDDNEINEMLAKAMHNESAQKLKDFFIMHSSSLYRDYLSEYLFGENGLLKNMEDGTLVIHHPERMQLYYQKKLARYIASLQKQKDAAGSLRIILCTERDIGAYLEDGRFERELYEMMQKNRISPGKTLHSDPELFKRYTRSMTEYYQKLYKIEQRGENYFEPVQMEYMRMGVNELNLQIERAVTEGGLREEKESGEISLKEYELNRIREMLSIGRTQKEICRALAISRSTLNRRLERMRELR